ncbi:phage holin family protein, partial [Limosilactobacillus reuteri]
MIIWLFVWVIIIDIITRTARSLVTHHTTSTKRKSGLIKHGILLIII